MGVLPLEFMPGESRKTLALTGAEAFTIEQDLTGIAPHDEVRLRILREDGTVASATLRARIDTQREHEWFRRGGVMPYVIDKLSKAEYD